MQEVMKLAALFGVLAITVPNFIGGETQYEDDIRAAKLETEPNIKQRRGTATATRDRSGHFNFNAKINGRHVKVLVDTGASAVAINRSTARRIGLKLSKSDFRHKAKTANGTALFARATLREIRIGGIKVRHVPAAVLDDRALDTTLLGMSFLNRLKRFEFKGNRLRLVQ